MKQKKESDKEYAGTPDAGPENQGETVETIETGILSSKQEVADELKMSLKIFERLEQKYPFAVVGVTGRINSRWKVTRKYVWQWFDYVQRQESRHPDARRMRPEEPPELSEIKGR